MLSGRNYMVQHGDYAVRPAPMSGGRCQRCMCQDGRLERCMNTTRGDCMVVRPPTSGSQRNCMIRGRMVPHGNRTRVRYTLISLYVLYVDTSVDYITSSQLVYIDHVTGTH